MNRTLLFGLAALFFMVVAALADCPNSCSGRGVCVNRSVCQCYTNWAGADCSYEDVALGHGQSISGSVAVDAWVFGHLQINGHSSIAWNVVQGVGGDCDIYIEKDNYPTRSKWLQRDISTKTNVTLVTPDATHGKWYIGIYGFAACTFQLTAHIYGECPRNCTNNGVCVNGVCSCNSGHTGPDCSEINPISLPLNTESQSATVPRNGWMYYTVPHVQPSTLLHFTLTQTIAGEDADLYLQVGGFPNFTSFLARNTTTLLVSTLDYAYNPSNFNPPVYVGVYGYTAATFKLAVHAATAPGGDCATVSKCSLHGTCRGQSCSCSNAYHGSNCEFKRNPIGLGQWESGYVADALWNYYAIGASSGLHELRVLLTESARAGGDCDLYVRAGGYPTSTSFDYFDVTAPGPSGGQSSLTIPSAALEGQAWYIGVYGFSSCTYNLTVTEVMKNNTQCGVHGSPNSDGTCVCRDYYAGANCEIPTTQLQKGVVANGTVAYNKWAYYHIKTPVNGTHAIQAHLAALEDYAEGDLWFYASMDGWPTLRAYDKSDTRVGVTIHSISYVASSQPFVSQDVFIGVFAGPYSQQTNTFSLVAWYPDF